MQRAVTDLRCTTDGTGAGQPAPATAPDLTVFAEPDLLPARVTVAAGDGRAGRTIDLGRDHAVIRFDGDTATPVVMVAVGLFKGVAVTVVEGPAGPLFRLDLLHGDRCLSVPLAVGASLDQVAERWHAWARLYGLPLLAVDADGVVHGALSQMGTFLAAPPVNRRRGSNLVGRRSRLSRRRGTPLGSGTPEVLTGYREIIARS